VIIKPMNLSNPANSVSLPVVLLGCGGHAAVLAAVLRLQARTILGASTPSPDVLNALPADIALLGDDTQILAYLPTDIQLINGVGSRGVIAARQAVFAHFKAQGYGFASVFHPSISIDPAVQLGEGCQVLAGAVLVHNAMIGDNVLINSRALIEHDCIIGAHSHVASGAVLCGGCEIGAAVHVGAGATLIQGVKVGNGAVIAAGAVVTRSVPEFVLVAGVPAQVKKQWPRP